MSKWLASACRPVVVRRSARGPLQGWVSIQGRIVLRNVALWLRPAGWPQERLWALVAQAWALLCATVLVLEATLEPGVLQVHEAAMQRHALGERAAIGVGPA
ncbi:MAG: hypothetical protein WA484_04400 [Solirubrobacteraceae bacterium]